VNTEKPRLSVVLMGGECHYQGMPRFRIGLAKWLDNFWELSAAAHDTCERRRYSRLKVPFQNSAASLSSSLIPDRSFFEVLAGFIKFGFRGIGAASGKVPMSRDGGPAGDIVDPRGW
jgi:hypothetical protein